MNVTCNKCGKRYVIADEKIAGKASVKIRCKQCQNLIQLTGGTASSASSAAMPAAAALVTSASPSAVSMSGEAGAAQRSPWEDEATRAMPAPDLTTQWFAMIQGKQEGPLDLRGLGMKVNGGEITLRTYLWKPGMEGWKRAADVPEVSSVFSGGTGASATATGPMQASPETQRAARASAPQRDVAVANEMPAADFASVSQIIASTPSTVPVAAAAVVAEAPLKDLFNDVHDGPEGHVNGNGKAGAAAAVPDKDDEEPTKGDVDPFAALGGSGENDAPPPGEATKFFMAQAGVNRRNPPWKIALFVVSVFVAPATALYLLSTLHVLPTVTVTTADGEVVQENFFSPSGIGGLKDILTGDQKRKAAEAEKRKAAAALAAKEKAAKAQAIAVAPVKTSEKPDLVPTPKPPDKGLADFYGNDTKKVNVPKGGRDDDRPPVVAQGGGLSSEAAMKIVADKRKSFEQCIDAALRRTPNLAVGNIVVVLTVGSSGAVKSVGVTPKKWEGADWAVCMMTAGKRIVFPGSDGDTDIEVPLKVGVAL